MKQVPDMRITIVGHTDDDGSAEANLKLSKDRANAVREILVSQHGIAKSRIETDGKGEASPVASNDTQSGKSQNRRVEFIKQ